MKHILSAGVLAVLCALPLSAQNHQNLSDRIESQAACIRSVQHTLYAIDKVSSVALPDQNAVLTHARKRAEYLLAQNDCQGAQRTLNIVQPVLKIVQETYLQVQTEDLEHLFLGPSTLEQRAMLRSGLQLLDELKEKGLLEEAIFAADYLDESFDTPPALSAEQRRDAYYHDAMETIDMWYQWGLSEANFPDKEQQFKRLQQKFVREITDIWTDSSLSEENMAAQYEELLDRAEVEFNQLIDGK